MTLYLSLYPQSLHSETRRRCSLLAHVTSLHNLTAPLLSSPHTPVKTGLDQGCQSVRKQLFFSTAPIPFIIMLGYVSGVCVLVSLGLRYKALLSPQQQHRVVVVASTSTSPLPSLKRSPRKGHIYSHIASVSINGGAATTRGTRSTPLSRLISELSSLPPVNSRWPFTQYSRLCHRHRRSFLQTSSSNSTHFPSSPATHLNPITPTWPLPCAPILTDIFLLVHFFNP